MGVYLVVNNPEVLKSNAASDQTRIEFVDAKGNLITQTQSPSVKIRLVYNPNSSTPTPSPSPTPSSSPTPTPPSSCKVNADCPKGQYCYIDGTCKSLPGASLPEPVTTCKGEQKSWGQLDSELKGANFPGPYNHTQQELDAYNRAACPQKTSLLDSLKSLLSRIVQPQALALTPGGKQCVYSESGTCHLGNCLDGSQNCSTNVNCGYVPGYSSGHMVDCRYGGASCIYSEGATCHQGNCLDGSQSCSFNSNCGYIPGYSSGATVSCPGSSPSPEPGGGFGLQSFNFTDYGVNIDPRDPQKVPTLSQFQYLNPAWVRYEYFPSVGLVKNIPTGVKQLLIFDYSSVSSDFPRQRSSFDSSWVSYINGPFTTSLNSLLNNVNVDAIEIWNEEDDSCSGGANGYCPTVPVDAYAAMLKKASGMIKAKYPNIKVIVGGLDSGQVSYVQSLKNAGALDQVDAVAIHPYGKSVNGWTGNGALTFGDLGAMVNSYQNASGKEIWITETSLPTTDQALQKEYLLQLSQAVSNVPVVIWYSFTDKMNPNYGLVDASGNYKQVAAAFHDLTASNTPNPYPSAFRLSNTQAGLNEAPEQLFDQNDKVVDWTLDSTPGLKTVYAQFKVNGVWGNVVSDSITLSPPGKTTSQFDIDADGKVDQKDLDLFMQIWKSGKYSKVADFNSDGVVNIIDYFMIFRAVHSSQP